MRAIFGGLAGLTVALSAVAGPNKAPPDLLGHFAKWKADPWDVDRYYSEILKSGKTSTPEALELLPDWMKASYTLVKHSADPEVDAGPESPRPVHFSPDGTFQVSYTGDEKDGEIRITQFDRKTEKIQLRVIKLAKGKTPTLSPADRLPVNCRGCHSRTDRPVDGHFIIDQYDQWNDWYGGGDDGIIPGSEEAKELADFKATAQGHPRFKILASDPKYPFYPFHQYDTKKQKNSPERGLSAMPNTRLTALDNRLQARANIQMISGGKLFDKYKFLLAYVLLDRDRDIAPFSLSKNYSCLRTDGKTPGQITKQQTEEAELERHLVRDMKKLYPGFTSAPTAARGASLQIGNLFSVLGLGPDYLDLSKKLTTPSRASVYLKPRPWEFSDGFFRMRDHMQAQLWKRLIPKSEVLKELEDPVPMERAFEIARDHYEGHARYQNPAHLSKDQMEAFDAAGIPMLAPKGGKAGFEKACEELRRLAIAAVRETETPTVPRTASTPTAPSTQSTHRGATEFQSKTDRKGQRREGP